MLVPEFRRKDRDLQSPDFHATGALRGFLSHAGKYIIVVLCALRCP